MAKRKKKVVRKREEGTQRHDSPKPVNIGAWYKPSFSKVLTEVAGGVGYAVGTITLWFARYKTGKSTLLQHFAYDFYAQTGKKTLWIDTEGGFDIYMAVNDAMLRDRFLNGKPDEVIVLKTIPDLKELFGFFGMEVDIERSDTGTSNFKYYGEKMVRDETDKRRKVPYCEAEEIIKKNNVGMLVLDSVTMIFKTAFGGGRENLPARSSAYGYLLGKLLILSKGYDLVTFVTAHETLSPGVDFGQPRFTGAENLKYFSKFWYQLEQLATSNPKLSGFRRVAMARFPNLTDWSRRGVIEFVEGKGIIDSSEEEIERRRAEIKKEYEGKK